MEHYSIESEFDLAVFSGHSPATAAELLYKKATTFGICDESERAVIVDIASLLADCRIREHVVIRKAIAILEETSELRGTADRDYLRSRLKWGIEISSLLPRSAKRTGVMVGDVFVVPIFPDIFAYVHYVHKEPGVGPLLKIFKKVSSMPLEYDASMFHEYLSPILISGISSAVKEGIWTRIGNRKVDNFTTPSFIMRHYVDPTDIQGYTLWQAGTETYLGKNLPDEYDRLELLQVLPVRLVEERILVELKKSGLI